MSQSNSYTASQLATVVAAVITSNTSLASLPGNVFLPATVTGLPRDSVVNVTAIVTLNETDLHDIADGLFHTLLLGRQVMLERLADQHRQTHALLGRTLLRRGTQRIRQPELHAWGVGGTATERLPSRN